MRNELSLQPIPIEAGIQQQFHQSHEFDQFGLFDEAFGRAKGKGVCDYIILIQSPLTSQL